MECPKYVGQPKATKCDRFIRMIDSATGKSKQHGWCGEYQCVHNPIYMARYDMYHNEEMQKETEEAQKRMTEAIAAQEPIPEPPSMTLEELNTPSPTAQKYANPADILKAVGIRQGKVKEEIPSTMDVDRNQPALQNLKLIEQEKDKMVEEIKTCSEIRMLNIIMKDAENKGYNEVVIKVQKKINSLSNLHNLKKG